MRIENLRRIEGERTAEIRARFVWEDGERSPEEIYYRVPAEFGEGLTCSPHAFLVAALSPAIRARERRIAIEAPICPELHDGLEVVMGWLNKWYAGERPSVAIESRGQDTSNGSFTSGRSACFFTGGVDSMATLRRNRLRYPGDHASAIKDGIIIYGLEVEQERAFAAVVRKLSTVARDANITLIPVSTNVRSLETDWRFWEFEWESAVYASVAHALARRLTAASISATYDIANMKEPYGSHPLLDPNYSSATLRIRHEGLTMSRLEKTRLVADWAAGLQHLRVCNKYEQYRDVLINCGRCEKCVRTMLGLAAIGALDRTEAFVAPELSAERVVLAAKATTPYMKSCYRELVQPLVAQGRHDLADAVRHVLRRADGELGWRGSLRRIDQKVLGGRLRLAKRVFAAAPRTA